MLYAWQAMTDGGGGDCASALVQVPAHEQLTYMNVAYVNDVISAPGVVVQGMQISHDKSPQRWKNVRASPRAPILWHRSAPSSVFFDRQLLTASHSEKCG